ncbi:hypothetical protein CA13_40230 [Planctomycetes bacterium CA13]|uniref:Uncharacterized protein YyaB-like PH domain-containing protein n=1 Tax=Novipirellula herctigrandis TaxID=2527986 RepID=A0A5C5Z5V0_9BACT|nr:hypothetical protein CA13_40230 [Planctomycetes bacterium CA13]
MNDAPKTQKPPIRFDSAVDLWLAALLFLAPVIAAFAGIYLILDGNPGDASILFLIGAASLAITGLFTVPCRYTVLEDSVSIRCGLLCYQIPFDQIQSVEKSGSLYSAPALSIRRVAIRTEKRIYLVSPKDRNEFIETLRRIAKID